MILIASFLMSTTISAQNSVYDVVPGSGPKKETGNKVFNNGTKKKNSKLYCYGKKRKKLPPGQAKKIYGGSATDYAPGQVKKNKFKKHRKHIHKH